MCYLMLRKYSFSHIEGVGLSPEAKIIEVATWLIEKLVDLILAKV